ncbi:MAG TPA: TfoX/Sxy family protein [candidate division Zixibacteria bacterium]|nr:TfoX/Sxy family protein [candidate division Zixibacteria bacterium]
MAKKDQSFHDFVIEDLLGDIDGITSRAMFGGWGIYKDGFIFAIIFEGELYFKADETTSTDFEKLGSHMFVYKDGEKQSTMSYWLLPAEVQENREMLFQYVTKSVSAAMSAKKTRRKRK